MKAIATKRKALHVSSKQYNSHKQHKHTNTQTHKQHTTQTHKQHNTNTSPTPHPNNYESWMRWARRSLMTCTRRELSQPSASRPEKGNQQNSTLKRGAPGRMVGRNPLDHERMWMEQPCPAPVNFISTTSSHSALGV